VTAERFSEILVISVENRGDDKDAQTIKMEKSMLPAG